MGFETKIPAFAVVMVIAIGATFAPAMADEAKGSFTIGGNPMPVVANIELYDDGTPTDEMTPQSEYELIMTISDESTLSDITELTVVIKERDYSGDDCASDQVTYTWTPSGWSLSPADSTWTIVTAECNVPTLTDTSGDWVLAFKPGKVAREDRNGWEFTVTATDSDLQADSGTISGKTMLWYGELTLIDTAYSFGIVNLSDSNMPIISPSDGNIDVESIANGDYEIKSKSEDWGTPDEGRTALINPTKGTLSSGQFMLQNEGDANPDKAAFVGSSYAAIPDFPAASLTGPTDVTGVINEIYLWLSVADTGLQVGDEYGGTYYVQIFKAGK